MFGTDDTSRKARVAEETRSLESDKIERADALTARESPKQRQASGVDQSPIHRQPGLSVMPGSWRRLQGKDGRDQGLPSYSASCTGKQHQCRTAPC